MYVQAVGWQQGRKDKIDLEAGHLKDKAGLYTCPPAVAGQKAFHATLRVHEEPINVCSRLSLSLCTAACGCCESEM